MPSDARDRMIDGAVRLLATRGLEGTSFAEVLAATGAPRGSIYHHFPDGKEQLVAAAVDLAGERALTTLETLRGRPADEIAAHFLDMWRSLLTGTGYRAGCAVLAVTVASDSPALLDRTRAVFRGWRGLLASLLVDARVNETDADAYATLLIASSEGAVVLSRAEKSVEPFETVAAQLVEQLARIAPGS